jgi:hypothetical protein
MELALDAIGLMASSLRALDLLGVDSRLGVRGVLLVHCYLDRCGVAEVA